MNALVRQTIRHSRDENTQRWMQLVRNIPRLTDDEGLDLARRFRDGDQQAGERLVAAHLYVVIQVALRLRVHSDLAFDLIQEGNTGLLDALHRFEPHRGIPFSAYSRYWARARMLAWVSSHHRIVRVSRPTRELAQHLARAREDRVAHGLPADTRSLADAVGATYAEAERAQMLADYHEAGLDLAPEPGQLPLAERLADDAPGPDELAARAQLAARMGDAVVAFADTLEPGRDQVIFFERVTSDEPTSLADLGRRFGVSRERARQLEARILRQFRTFLEDWMGDAAWAA
jgi:RNA polymerase sigma-32 factor